MKLDHLILTRFCARLQRRLTDIEGPGFGADRDPLAAYEVSLRRRMLEIASLPSVTAQAGAGVGWVLVADPALPTRDRAWLEARAAGLPRAHVHYLGPQDDLRNLEWLEPYLVPDATHVLTSNLDDDDAVPHGWAAHLEDILRQRDELPEVMVLASQEVLEWDLVPRATAPFGFVKPWHRGRFPSSCGLTLLSSRAVGACVLGMRHRFCAAVMDASRPVENRNMAYYRERFAPTIARWSPQELFFDFGASLGPVLMSNHHSNSERSRLHEAAEARQRVRTVADLGDAPVDLSAYLRAAPWLAGPHPRRAIGGFLDRLAGSPPT